MWTLHLCFMAQVRCLLNAFHPIASGCFTSKFAQYEVKQKPTTRDNTTRGWWGGAVLWWSSRVPKRSEANRCPAETIRCDRSWFQTTFQHGENIADAFAWPCQRMSTCCGALGKLNYVISTWSKITLNHPSHHRCQVKLIRDPNLMYVRRKF